MRKFKLIVNNDFDKKKEKPLKESFKASLSCENGSNGTWKTILFHLV